MPKIKPSIDGCLSALLESLDKNLSISSLLIPSGVRENEHA